MHGPLGLEVSGLRTQRWTHEGCSAEVVQVLFALLLNKFSGIE